jgi:hypothetical protein
MYFSKWRILLKVKISLDVMEPAINPINVHRPLQLPGVSLSAGATATNHIQVSVDASGGAP